MSSITAKQVLKICGACLSFSNLIIAGAYLKSSTDAIDEIAELHIFNTFATRFKC